MSKSEEKTDWLGNKYIQHYDDDGNKSGTSEEKTDWLGNEYTQHYDNDGNKSGTSEEKTDWLGNEYTQHYDNDGNKVGTSEEKEDWLGNSYTQHYDDDGNKSSYSEEKTDWLGNDYTDTSTSSGSNWCFLTTACVEHKGLKDNCYELETLRAFRDNYVKKAPSIVRKIKSSNNKKEILDKLYEDIQKAVKLIEGEEYEKAFELYYNIATKLRKEHEVYVKPKKDYKQE